jgi:hypothetical protein
MDKQFSVVDLLSSFLPEFIRKQYESIEETTDEQRNSPSILQEEETSPEIVCFPALVLSLRLTNSEQIIQEPLMDQWNDHYVTMSSLQTDSKEHDIPLLLTDIIEQVSPLITRFGT